MIVFAFLILLVALFAWKAIEVLGILVIVALIVTLIGVGIFLTNTPGPRRR